MTLSNIQVLMDKIYDIKEKVSDQEYIDLCNLLNDVRVSQDEQVNNNNEASDNEESDNEESEEDFEARDEAQMEEQENRELFNNLFMREDFIQFSSEYDFFDVIEYNQQIRTLIHQFVRCECITIRYLNKSIEENELIHFLMHRIEATPSYQYPGYNSIEFFETFKTRFPEYADVNVVCARFLRLRGVIRN